MSFIANIYDTPAHQFAVATGLLLPAAVHAVMGPLSSTTILVINLGTQIITYLGWQGVSRCLAERKLGPGFQRWCDDAPPNVVDGVTERDRRLIVKDRIVKCFVNWRTYLDLEGLGLSSIPPQLNVLTRLESLNISHNQLTALPPELCSLKNLRYLYAANNRLTALPLEFSALTNLNVLDLGTNQLETLPMLNNLAQLRSVHLENNHITVLPELGNLQHLRTMSLRHNPLTALPPGFFSLPENPVIKTDGCPFSDRTLQQIQRRVTASDYDGPFFSDLNELMDVPAEHHGPFFSDSNKLRGVTAGPPVDRWADWAS